MFYQDILWRNKEGTSIGPCSELQSMKNCKLSHTKDSWRTPKSFKKKRFRLLESQPDLLKAICLPGTPTFEDLRALHTLEEFSIWRWNSLWAIPTILQQSDCSQGFLIQMCSINTSASICCSSMRSETNKEEDGHQPTVLRVFWPSFKAFSFKNSWLEIKKLICKR